MAAEFTVQGFEIGIVTTNLEPMLAFYRDRLGFEFSGDLDFVGGTMKRFQLGQSTLKLVTYDEPPKGEVVPGGGQAARGFRYLSIVVANLREVHDALAEAGYEIAEPLTEFGGGIGFFFVVDPDGNWIEVAGPLG